MKASYRNKIKHLEITRLKVSQLTFRREQIEIMVERKVQESMREFDHVEPYRH